MFDIGFWELALIGVVALLVVGPDRLPGLARTVGLWVGRIRRYVATVRDDIEREIQADELRKMLDKSDELDPLKEVIDETAGTIGEAKKELAAAEKKAGDLLSEDAAVEPVGSAARSEAEDSAGDDEPGDDPPTPRVAATAVGEAMTGRGAPAATDEGNTVEDSEEHERRPG